MKNVLRGLVAGVAALGVAACSGGGSSSGGGPSTGGSTNLTISGSLSAGASAQIFNNSGLNTGFAVSLADLEIYAIAFTTPPVIDQAEVDPTTGAFKIELPGAKGASVTAIVRDKVNTSQEVATIVFRDTTKKDLSGNPKDSSSVVLSDSVSLGSLTIGNDGKVIVDVQTTIANQIAPPASSGTAFNMSGVWVASAYTGTKPADYYTTTYDPATCNEGGGYGCAGVAEGFPLGLVRVAGKTFTPVSNCDIEADPVVCAEGDGTLSSTVDRYALGIWDARGLGACGFKVGFTEAEARAGGRLHPTEALPAISYNFNGSVASGTMSFGAMTAYNPYFWIRSAATASRDFYDCRGTSVTVGGHSVPGYACKGNIQLNSDQSDTGADGWMVSLGNGGCVDTTTNKPVFISNWQGMTPSGCQDETNSSLPAGFTKNACTQTGDPDGAGPSGSVTVRCAWVNGSFEDQAGAPNFSSPVASDRHVGPPAAIISVSGACGGTDNITAAAYKNLSLAQLQCHADDYHMNQNSFSGASCAPKARFNWGAKTAADFFQTDYRPKPDAQFLMDLITYDSSGSVATMDTEEREGFTISTGDSSVSCEVARRTIVNIKKQTDTTAIVDISFSGRMASTAAACLSVAKTALENRAYNDSQSDQNLHRRAVNNTDLEYILGKEGFIFNLTKQ